MKYQFCFLALFAVFAIPYPGRAQSQNSGIGTVVPNSKLEIRGIGTTSVSSSFNVTTSDSTSVFYIRDDRKIGINTASPQYNLDAVGTMRVQSTFSGATNSATGGTITTSGAYTIHTFTTSGTFTPAQDMIVEYLVVAGGGGGGGAQTIAGVGGGGGGAGGMLTGNLAVTATGYSVAVGAGGAGGLTQSSPTRGTSGSNSSFSSVIATGGGGGGGFPNTGYSGGSGGGGIYPSTAGGTGTAGQGSNGGTGASNGAGGGGKGGVGANANSSTGGAGQTSSISGSAVSYAGGGGGGGGQYGAGNNTGGSASAGGGAGGNQSAGGANGTANTGGGGGGAGNGGGNGGAGGSGIVIIRYLTNPGVATTLFGDVAGRVAIGQSSPTAFLHLPSGVETANFAPLKFTSGTNLATAEAGAVEYDGTRLYYTTSAPTRITLLGHNLGLSGGTTLIGGTAASENLTIKSTSHATKGKILFGSSAYDEVNNRLGLGTTSPGYLLTVNGQPAANGYTAFTNYSDSRLKRDIMEVEGGNLEKIMQLHPVKFKYNNEYLRFYNDSSIIDRPLKGFIAQEVKEIFPEMVGSRMMDDGTEYYDLNLSNLPVYIVKAMQEQQTIIINLKTELETLKARVQTLEQQ